MVLLDWFVCRLEQTKHFGNTCIYLTNKDQLKGAAVTFTVLGQFAEFLVILCIGNKVEN
jgi:hypothetical protein